MRKKTRLTGQRIFFYVNALVVNFLLTKLSSRELFSLRPGFCGGLSGSGGEVKMLRKKFGRLGGELLVLVMWFRVIREF